MNKEEAIKKLNILIIDWSENGINTKLNQIDINAIIFILNELDIANKKLDDIKELAENRRQNIYLSNLKNEIKYEVIILISDILSIIGEK